MIIKRSTQLLAALLLIMMVSLACGTFQVGIISSDENPPQEAATEDPSFGDVFSSDSEQPSDVQTIEDITTEPSIDNGETEVPPDEMENVDSVLHKIVYVGNQGNLWVLSLPDGESIQLTTDATTPEGDGTVPDLMITYSLPKISSDGRYVAVRRDEGHAVEYGLDFSFSLMVYDVETTEAVQVYDQHSIGYDWKPGSNLLAFAPAFSEEYFATRGQPDASFAESILGFDMETRTAGELVPPEGGYALSSPVWSPDGRYLAFQEVLGYEGSGYFAYYDFESSTYQSWEEAIGLFDWSPDGTKIIYDRLTYTATGDERIFIRDLIGGAEQMITTDITSGYGFAPAFSPHGDRIAYFAHDGVRDFEVYSLYIRILSGGDTVKIGEFSNIDQPEWSTDGSLLIFSSGTYGSQQIIKVSVEDSSYSVVAEGSFPTIATLSD